MTFIDKIYNEYFQAYLHQFQLILTNQNRPYIVRIFSDLSHIITSLVYISKPSAWKINCLEYLPLAVTLSLNTLDTTGIEDWLVYSLIV